MKHRYAPLIFLPLVLNLVGCSGGEAKSSDYYPTKVGTTWHYRSPAGPIKTSVIKHETIGDVMCARLETNGAGQTAAEHVALGNDGMYRYTMAGQKLDPPIRFLKLPFAKGDQWDARTRVGGQNLSVTYVIDEEEIVVPAGKFKTVVTRTTNFEVDNQKMAATFWYAKGVGMVKMKITMVGGDIVIELEKFEPPK